MGQRFLKEKNKRITFGIESFDYEAILNETKKQLFFTLKVNVKYETGPIAYKIFLMKVSFYKGFRCLGSCHISQAKKKTVGTNKYNIQHKQ